VFGFYTLSGYLISLTIHRNYNSISGLPYFFANRIVRIYPTYWVCLAISAGLAAFIGADYALLNRALLMPSGESWFANLFIFGLLGEFPRLLPPAWSLNIELVYYILMALLLTRHRFIALIWLVASIALVAEGVASDLGWSRMYFNFRYPSFCFALGACTFHFRDQLLSAFDRLPVRMICFLACLYPCVPAVTVHSGGNMNDGLLPIAILYMSSMITALMILALHVSSERPSWLYRYDQLLADMSYPVFLVHWPVIALMSITIFEEAQRGIPLMLVSLPMTYFVSYGVVRLVEAPSRRLRSWIRNKSRQSQRIGEAVGS